MDLVRRRPLAFRQAEFGTRVRAARESLGLTQQQVQDELSMDAKTIRRLEGGREVSQPRTVRTVLDFYRSRGLRAAEAEALLALTRPVDQPDWLHPYDADLTEALHDLVVLEAHAATIRNYPGQFLPGLLHTEDYAMAAIMGAFPRVTKAAARRLVDVRLRRQQALPESVQLSTVIDEAALWRVVGGPQVMRAQLRQLLDQPSNIDIRVIPYAAGAHPGMSGGFTLMTFRESDFAPVVYVDSMDGDLLREEPERVARFAEMYDRLSGATLGIADSARLIAAVADKIGN